MRKLLALLGGAVVALPLGLVAMSPAQADVTVGVRVDAHVNQLNPTTNYETATVMNINNATNDRYMYLKVDVPAAPAGENVTGGVLRFYVSSNNADANPHTITVDKVTNNWTEAGVTWDTQPPVEVANLATVPFNGNGWYEIPVSGINPGSVASFRVGTTSGGFINIDSQENASGNGPQFRLTSAPVAPPTPKVIIGMSALPGDWDQRLSEVGRCGIEARRIFNDLDSTGRNKSALIERAVSDGMIPVISYKVPSVSTLNSNGYDSWLNNLNTYLASLNTTVSVTFWHEPRGDMTPEAFRAGSQQFLDHLNAPNIKVGPILNGWLLDNRTEEFASYTSQSLINEWDFLGLDTYQSNTTPYNDDLYGGRAVPLARTWLDSNGNVNEPILVGEYNGFTAESLRRGGEQILLAENKVWIGALWNSHVDGGLGEPLQPGTDRMAAFKATKADSRALHEEGCGTSSPSEPEQPTAIQPVGVSGDWQLAFHDEFDGTSLDLSKWESTWFGDGTMMNNVGTYARNVSVANGEVRLQLESSSRGALIHTGYGPGKYQAPVGSYTEARVWFPGNGSRLYNWPAWWINSTDDYPMGGEHDIAEVLGDGVLTINYHNQNRVANNSGAIPGYWGDAWHTFGVHRKASSADVYWDGKLMRSYSTLDDGRPLDLILNTGSGKGPLMTGSAGAMRIDYVRSWQ